MKTSKRKPAPSAASEKKAPPAAKPTVEQLALLGATLSKSKLGDRVEPPGSLVSRAMAIWKAADELLERPQPPPAVPERPRWEQPKEEDYPVTMDKFLDIMLAHLKGRKSKMHSILRDYVKDRLRNPESDPLPDDAWPGSIIRRNRYRILDCCDPRIDPETSKPYSCKKSDEPNTAHEPTEDEVDRRINFCLANPIPDRKSFFSHAERFQAWFDKQKSKKRSAAGAKGLASRDARVKRQSSD